jgi:sugar-specific transcriptional regulator TrmB
MTARKNRAEPADVVALLQDLGLTSYEARVYVAVLTYPEAAPSAVAAAAGVPRPKVYETLERLLKRGLAVRTSGRRFTYRAVPPAEVVALLARAEDERRKTRDRSAAAARAALDTLVADANADPLPGDSVEILKSPHLILTRQNRLWRGAKTRVWGTSKPPYVMTATPRSALEEAAQIINRALKRGVEWRTIFEVKDERELAACAPVNYFVERGEKVRWLKRLPLKMAVADGRECLVSLESPLTAEPTVTVLAINHRGLAGALEALFEKLWDIATPYQPPPRPVSRKK